MKYIFILMLILFTHSAKSQHKSITLSQLDSLLYFKPFSSISIITKGNKQAISDSLSADAQKLQWGIVRNYSEQIHLADSFELPDNYLYNRVAKEFYYLHEQGLKQMWKHNNFSVIQITPVIDSILMATKHRFAMLIANQGFTRASGNYAAQVEKDIGIAILTLGAVGIVPYKALSEVYVVIVDSQNKNVVYFTQWMWPKKEPLDEKVLDEQFRKLVVEQFKPRNK
jgi:hypothetical protein